VKKLARKLNKNLAGQTPTTKIGSITDLFYRLVRMIIKYVLFISLFLTFAL